MELREFEPRVIAKEDFSEEMSEFTIAPIGDLQLIDPDVEGFRAVAVNAFKRHMAFVEDNFPNVHYIGMGDYIDFMSPSNRDSVGKAKMYQPTESFISVAARRLADDFLEIVQHTTGRWMGLLSGHHYYEFKDGTNTDQYIANALEAPYLNKCGYLTMRFQRPDDKNRGTINIWAHHGVGSRKFPVGKLVDNVVPYWPEADVYLMGHMHECDYKKIERMIARGGQIVENKAIAVVTGGWLKGYVEDTETYIEEKMLSPRAIGAPVILVKTFQKNGLFRRKFQYVDAT